MTQNIRELALDTLLTLEREDELSHRLIRAVLDKYDYLDAREKAFYKRLCEGTIERQVELDYHLDRYASLPVRKMKPLIRCLMRMSAYQLLYMDSVPDSAVCDEACKLADKRGFRNLKGFVNGVLRKLASQKGRLVFPEASEDPVRYLSVTTSTPRWLTGRLLEEYGEIVTERMLRAMLSGRPVNIRIRGDLGSRERERLFAEFAERGILLSPGGYLPDVFLLEGGELRNPAEMPGFSEGLWTIQDVSSALAVEAAGIRPGDLVLDPCAAPGGKSLLAAEKTGAGGRVLSRDVSPYKAELLADSRDRMRAGNMEISVRNAEEFDEGLEGLADVLLLDVPCSGLGVLGRKRDIKYRVTEASLREIADLQRRIIDACWRYVKPGGILLYSTCTLCRGENEEQVLHLLEELPFAPCSLERAVPERLWRESRELDAIRLEGAARDACMKLVPGFMDSDGFFFAKLQRKL